MDLIDRFEAWALQTSAPRTVQEYGKILRRGISLGDITAQATRTDLTASYRKLAKCALLAFCRFREAEGGPSGPEQALHIRKVVATIRLRADDPHVTEPLTAAELDRFRAAAARLREPHRSLVALIVATGCRVSDACRIHRSAAEATVTSGLRLTIEGKGADKLSYPADLVREPLQQLLQHPTPWTWSHEAVGRDLDRAVRGLRRACHAAGRAAGLRRGRGGRPGLHPHVLRHTLAVDILERTKDVHAASQALGHRNISTRPNATCAAAHATPQTTRCDWLGRRRCRRARHRPGRDL